MIYIYICTYRLVFLKVVHAIIGFRMMSRGTVLMVEVVVMVQDLSSAARWG